MSDHGLRDNWNYLYCSMWNWLLMIVYYSSLSPFTRLHCLLFPYRDNTLLWQYNSCLFVGWENGCSRLELIDFFFFFWSPLFFLVFSSSIVSIYKHLPVLAKIPGTISPSWQTSGRSLPRFLLQDKVSHCFPWNNLYITLSVCFCDKLKYSHI